MSGILFFIFASCHPLTRLFMKSHIVYYLIAKDDIEMVIYLKTHCLS